MNRRLVLTAVLAIAFGSLAAVAIADEGDEHGKSDGEITVQGEILDMSCYIAHGATGEEHAGCAKRCVKDGQPMGLLGDEGTVYLLYASHKDASAFEQAKDHAGQKVEIVGQEATRNGIKGIEVHGVKAM